MFFVPVLSIYKLHPWATIRLYYITPAVREVTEQAGPDTHQQILGSSVSSKFEVPWELLY